MKGFGQKNKFVDTFSDDPFFSKNQKEKEGLFSVGGFETETSNFALNSCPRVSKNQKFHARSKKKSRLIPSTL
jgi:hypothetical protein